MPLRGGVSSLHAEERLIMHAKLALAALALAVAELTGCTPPEPPTEPAAVGQEAVGTVAMPPFKPVATTAVLMRGTVQMAAERYWESVAIVIDADGVHENYPQTDEEWFEVWEAGMTLAESGNLLMMPSRALDQGEWMRLSEAMIDAGLNAARAADAQDFERVLDEGEKVYNVCTECHEIYFPQLRL
jgi:hypothetical protein